MGIRGLQTYLQRNIPNACNTVSLTRMIHQYKANNPNFQDVVIVVDGSSCASWLYGRNLDWVCGGEWREFEVILERFVKAFQNIGVKLVFFFDGMNCDTKPEQWVTRRLKEFNEVKAVFNCIKHRKPIPSDVFIIPPNYVKLLQIALKCIPGVTVFHNLSGECDQIIASYALQHNCLAILAQDTDYIVFPTVPYASITNLDLDTMTTVVYCRDTFCKEIGLEISMLPLLACLLGNDYISRDSLSEFHKWVCRTFDHRRSSHQNPFMGKIISCVTKYISSLNITNEPNNKVDDRLDEICYTAFRKSLPPTKFRKAVQTYNLQCSGSHFYSAPSATAAGLQTAVQDDVYAVLLKKTVDLEILPMLLDVISVGKIELSVSLEDRLDNHIAPYAMVYRPIRRRFYRAIFALRDHFIERGRILPHTGLPVQTSDKVEEWFASSANNVTKDKITSLSLNMSDKEVSTSVYQFLTNNKSEKMNASKWTLLKQIVGITISLTTLLAIPDQLKPLCIVINYIVQNPQAPLQLWEIETFLAQAVHPNASNVSWHSSLQVKGYNARAVHLATLFMRGVGTVLEVASICGNALENSYFIPWHFFDGKRFHHCYVDMINCGDVQKLFNNEGASLEQFHILKNAVLEGVDMKTCFSTL